MLHLPQPAVSFGTQSGSRHTAQNATHFDTYFLSIPDWVHGPIRTLASRLSPRLRAVPEPRSSHPHHRAPATLVPVNYIPLNPADWPPSCSQWLGLPATCPWEQLQLGNLSVGSRPRSLLRSRSQPGAAAKHSGPPVPWSKPKNTRDKGRLWLLSVSPAAPALSTLR